MTCDTKLAIYLRKKELSKLERKQAEFTKVQERIEKLKSEIKQLEENGK